MAIRWQYWLDFVTVPVTIALLCPKATSIAGLISGYVIWVLVEYWMHRWLFHVVLRRAHMVHHMRPHDAAGQVSSFQTFAVLVPLLLANLALGIDSLLVGFLGGYLSYIVAHHLTHSGWYGGHQPEWVKRHELHHRGQPCNYNVLCPLGDLLFGTYRSASKAKDHGRNAQ